MPDTLDWHQYYPLEIGNAWEWTTFILVSYRSIDRREIVGDTLINNKRYFIQWNYTSATDHLQNDFTRSNTTFLRYDDINTQIVALERNGIDETPYSCNLGADFGTVVSCPRWGGVVDVGGGYSGTSGYITVGGDEVPYNAVKGFDNIGGGVSYLHGIGTRDSVPEGAEGSTEFTYLRLSGIEYGQQVVFVGVERINIPRTDVIDLYPNPVHDGFVIESSGTNVELSITIYDLLGRVVIDADNCGVSRCTIRTSHVPSGVYYARIRTKEILIGTKRFTVIR